MKYKLTNNTKQIGDTTLYQIQALKDFSNVKKGDLGGWIEKESNLSQDDNSWVYDNARVYGDARVFGDAWVYGKARVSEDAMVYGNAMVYGDVMVCGNAMVYGNTMVHGKARVCGNAMVYGNAVVSGDYNYTKGQFIGGDDSCKITNITDKTGTSYWKAQYVLGDYEISPIEEEIQELTIADIEKLVGKKVKIVK